MQDENETRDDRILCFIPSVDIDYDVIRTDIASYLGPDASVTREIYPRTGMPGYYVRAYRTLTIPMISDLKLNTIKWRDEQRTSRGKDYRSSKTYARRQKGDATRPLVIDHSQPEREGTSTVPSTAISAPGQQSRLYDSEMRGEALEGATKSRTSLSMGETV